MSFLNFLSSPVTLAALAVIAIGVVIYEIVSGQDQEPQCYRSGGKGPSPGRGAGSPSSGFSSSHERSYEDTANSIRQRKQKAQSDKTKSCSQTNAKSEDKRNLSDSSKETTCNSQFDEKDYFKNVFDKIGNDVANLNKNNDEKKTFQKSIDDCPANSTSVDVKEVKLINTQMSNANHERVRQNALGNTVTFNQEANPTNYNGPCSTEKIVANNKQNHTETDNSFCTACEEVLANALAYPCKHCYLCINCATIVHRIYKKCSECESEIEYFQTIEK